MKTKEKQQLATKNIQELQTMLSEARKTLLVARLELSQNKLKNTRSLSVTRKTIAQILTAMRMQKENK